jgi:NTF2 fold immunity protein
VKICVALTFSLWIVVLALAQVSTQDYRPKDGYVPDSTTAVKIAEAVLLPVYGKKQIDSEEPFNAKLKDGVWTVSGTLRCPDGRGGISNECDGGVAIVQISKIDAHVISMIHVK